MVGKFPDDLQMKQMKQMNVPVVFSSRKWLIFEKFQSSYAISQCFSFYHENINRA